MIIWFNLIKYVSKCLISWNFNYQKNMNSKNSTTLAIPFISFHENQGFRLSPEAQQFLTSLPDNRQLGIVSIVGKYRTGKSFFVNRVLLDQKKGGFQVGPTINPCTKGLWLWKKTIQSESNKDMDLILIDTEGFGGMDQNANHDSRIFLFSLLLSSYFIYNSVGSIDQNAINTLNLIINLAKDIQTKTNNISEDESQFPSFLWIVRDFTLKLVDKNETPITPKEYLENALDFQKGTSDAIQNKNKIRRLLKHFFQDRDCEIMVRPTEAEKDLQKLDQIDNSLLRPEFVNQVKNIRSKVYSKVKGKKVNGQFLNGNLLVSLCKGYMQTINKGHLPNVESAWFYVCRSEGLKAVSQASKVLEGEIDELLKAPINLEELEEQKRVIREKVMKQFKKRAMNSEQGHPDLVEKLERRMDEYFAELQKKNSEKWTQVYKELAEEKIEQLREKLYNEEYESFAQFVEELEQVKQQFSEETSSAGQSVEKWHHFNELAENLYRLAGEAITEKLNNNLIFEKQLLEQRINLQEEDRKQVERQLKEDKDRLKAMVQGLERQNARLKNLEQGSSLRSQQYKNSYDQLYQKHQLEEQQNYQLKLEVQRLKRELRSKSQQETQQSKSELFLIKTTMEKERSLYEMEKQFQTEQLTRYKDRCNTLESQNRKIRQQSASLTSDHEELLSKFEEKCQQLQLFKETNENYSKRIEKLLLENSKKNQLVGDYNEWLLEKSYLQNQVAFLKNTMMENKKLHDALLVAFQKSVTCNEQQTTEQLVQANKNMSNALEKVQEKYRVLEEKYSRLKDMKKILKNCTAMECSSCSKLIATASFAQHIEHCSSFEQQENQSSRTKTLADQQQALHISVSQNVVKQSEDRKKPYTEYIVQITRGDEQKWKVHKRYKEFTELQQMLINKFPYIKYPPSCNFLADINTLLNNKKNIMAEQRRKSLQQYLRDLSKIQEIRESDIFKHFLQISDDNLQNTRSIKKPSMSKSNIVLQESNLKKKGLLN